jgi:hypothetical protein
MIKVKLFLKEFFFFSETSYTEAAWLDDSAHPSHNDIPPS